MTEEYKLGFELGEQANCYALYADRFGYPIGGSKGWRDFIQGQSDRKRISYEKKFREYKLVEFTKELDILCEKYGVSLVVSSNGGCCPGGAQCRDIEFCYSNLPADRE